MWNFDGFVQNEYYVLRFSIWIQVILWHCRFLFFARQLQFPPSRRIYSSSRKFDNVLFLMSVTWGIFIFWSRGKDLVKYFSRFLLSELAWWLQNFTSALDFLPKSCHCSRAPRQLMSAVHLWVTERRRGVADGTDRASLSEMRSTAARRRPQLFSALSCNGRIWAKSLRLMQNFDDFVMIQETEIPKSIWLELIPLT